MKDLTDQVAESALDVADGVQQVISDTEEKIESTIKPVRQNILKRFPTAFLLAVTFGVSITFFGIEQLLSRVGFLNGHPWISLIVGIGILVATGTLYKKLG
tara:strand:+ start:1730 stop:2032 length:303 start_codon:yes stop_codon:yes gene_type:complete